MTAHAMAPMLGHALIAFGLLTTFYCLIATTLSRRWGTIGLGAAVLLGSGFILYIAWGEAQRLPTAGDQAALWGSMLAGNVITFLVPATVIHRLGRRAPQPSFGRTVLLGVGSAYAALATGVLGGVVLVLLARLWRTAVA